LTIPEGVIQVDVVHVVAVPGRGFDPIPETTTCFFGPEVFDLEESELPDGPEVAFDG
jgi:hypothetical protein